MFFFSVYGAYYAFDEPQIEIERGDIVHWSWETPDFVNDITHAIIEVDSASSTVAKEGGFTSGSPTRNGKYQSKCIPIMWSTVKPVLSRHPKRTPKIGF